MCPEVEKWYSPVPRNPKMVQSNAEKLKILRTIRPEVQKRYSRGQSRFSLGRCCGNARQGTQVAWGSPDSGGAPVAWDSRGSVWGDAVEMPDSVRRWRGAVEIQAGRTGNVVSRDSVLRRCCRDDSWSIRFRSSGHSHCRTHCPNDSGHPTDAGSSGVCRTERS